MMVRGDASSAPAERTPLRARVGPRMALIANLIAGGVLFAVTLGALLAPQLAGHPPDAVDLDAQLAAPSQLHPLGADFYGRDILSRLLFGARATLGVAAAATALAVTAGAAVGALAGSARGWLAQFWAGLIDLLLAFPAFLLALIVVALLGPSLWALALAVGIAGIPSYARAVRGIVLSIRSAPFVEAAQALGAGPVRILVRHLLPGVTAAVAALASVDLGRAITGVAALGFLGLGAPPPRAEWGQMLFEGRSHLASAPWASAFPGLAITLTVLAATLLGDAITDARTDHRP